MGIGGGEAVKESVARPLVRHVLAAIGEKLAWHGAMSIDYLIKNGDATPLLIDCNPRLVEPMGVRTHLSRCRRCSAARPTAARGAIFSARLKPTNKAERSAAELGEPRAGAEGNVGQYSTDRARNRATVSPGLERIRQVSPLNTKGGSRMWESRLYGSVRGALRNERPYRDRSSRSSQ